MDKYYAKMQMRFEEFLSNSAVRRDIAIIQEYGDEEVHHRLIDVMRKYDLPNELAPVLSRYLETSEVTYDLLLPPVRVYSDSDKRMAPYYESPENDWLYYDFSRELVPRVHLLINPDATRTEIKAFIDEYWDSEIKPRLIETGRNKQRRSSRSADKDTVIRMRAEGKTSTEIADFLSPDDIEGEPMARDAEAVRQIVHREKKRFKRDTKS